jgi:hypothetical protein
MRPTKIFTKANVIKIKALADNGFGALQIAHAMIDTGQRPRYVQQNENKVGPHERFWL